MKSFPRIFIFTSLLLLSFFPAKENIPLLQQMPADAIAVCPDAASDLTCYFPKDAWLKTADSLFTGGHSTTGGYDCRTYLQADYHRLIDSLCRNEKIIRPQALLFCESTVTENVFQTLVPDGEFYVRFSDGSSATSLSHLLKKDKRGYTEEYRANGKLVLRLTHYPGKF